jgi:hypothetical protein
MRKFTLFVTLIISCLSHAQDSVSVLFIGNSYVYVNDLPTVFSNLTTSLGDEVTIDSKTNGGFTFQNHLNDALTHTKIESKSWDYVVLQGQSQEPSFPTSQVNSQTLPPAVSLSDSVYANWYCSQAMYFMTWGRQNGDPQWDSINTFDKMNVRLRNSYLRIADSAQASVAPAGIAWKYVRDNHPTINLFSADGSHPSSEGTYLSACTFYASVFRKSPVGASYTFGLDATTAGILQNAAAIAVLDSLETWHLRPRDELSIADFQYVINGGTVQFLNNSWRSNAFNWSFGDGGSSTDESPSYTYSTNGTYSVQLIASSECGDDTLMLELVIDYLSVSESLENDWVKKDLGNGKFELTGDHNFSTTVITLMDATGKQINTKGLVSIYDEQQTILVDLSSIPAGMYFLRFSNENGEIIIDLPKHQ